MTTDHPKTVGSRAGGTLRHLATAVLVLCAMVAVADTAAASDGKDGRKEVRVAGTCGAGPTSKLRLRARDGGIELEFEVDHNRAGSRWRVAIVHERRVVWRGVTRTVGASGSFAVERRLQDLVGADSVTARAWGPAGVTCRATAVLL